MGTHGDGPGGLESWLEDLERMLAKVIIIKRRPKLGWRSNHDTNVTFLNWLVELQMENSRVSAMELDPRQVDFLEETCILSAWSRSASAPGDKKTENHDDAPLMQPEIGDFRSATVQVAFIASDVPVIVLGANRRA